MGFLGPGFNRFGGDVLVEFDDLDARLFLFAHYLPGFFRRFDQIAALTAESPSGRRTNQTRARRPDARTANFSEVCALSLRERPFIVILGNIGTGGNPKMKINLADEVEQVTVAVDQAGKNGFAFDVDDASVRGDSDVAAFADRFDAFACDDDHGIFDWWSTRSIDERAAL